MLLTRVLARFRSVQGRAYVLGVLFTLLTLVPLAHASPPDPVWIAGIYDMGDFDEVVSMLIGADALSQHVTLTGTPFLLPVSVLKGVGVSPGVAVVSSTIRPRSPPRV